jgi:hypothetical protein
MSLLGPSLRRFLFGLGGLAVGACDECGGPAPLPPLDVADGCQPLAPSVDCGLPYPSDFFVVDDATLPSGRRVEFRGPAKMRTTRNLSADITEFLPQDGFSRQPPIVAGFGVAVDVASVPGFFADPAATTADAAPTALIEAATGRRIPHFVDVDVRAEDPARQTVVMRPLERLAEKTRYVVALSGLRTVDGALVAPPEGFRRLRDREAGADPALRPFARYDDDVFAVVTAAGLARADLQLAWDFTTGSDEHVTADLLRARSLVLDELERTPPQVTADVVFEGGGVAAIVDASPDITWRIVRGTITGPRVVEDDDPGALLFRDADGQVALNGTTTFAFTAILPRSVRDGFAPASVLFYGHGFFGQQGEVEDRSTREFGDKAGMVSFAIDWVGMSSPDIGVVASTVGDRLSEGLRFGERVPQAMMNWLTLQNAIQTGLMDDVTVTTGTTTLRPFRRPDTGDGVVADPADGTRTNAGQPVLSRGDGGFLGMSMGHILGGVLSALDPHLQRSVLHIGGAGFAHMMYRARPFAGFQLFLQNVLPDPLEQQKLAAHFQRQFDRFDPATWAPYVLVDELPVGPSSRPTTRRVLQQMGLADSQVPNLGSQLHARLLGLVQVTPSAGGAIFGLVDEPAPRDGSGFFAFDLGFDGSFAAVPDFPDLTPVHDNLRFVDEVQDQAAAFLRDGVIVNPCDGSCGVLPLP